MASGEAGVRYLISPASNRFQLTGCGENKMWHIVRIGMVFIFGTAMTQTIEDSPTGAFIMGAIALGLTVTMIVDIMGYVK